jgi:hypothetical protein
VWTTAIVGANVPGGATMRLSARLADAEHAVRAAPIVPLPTVPPGTTGAPVIIDLLPSMRVANPNLATERSTFMAFEATLEASADGRAVPRLDGVELQYECVPAEVVRALQQRRAVPARGHLRARRGALREQPGRTARRALRGRGLAGPGERLRHRAGVRRHGALRALRRGRGVSAGERALRPGDDPVRHRLARLRRHRDVPRGQRLRRQQRGLRAQRGLGGGGTTRAPRPAA